MRAQDLPFKLALNPILLRLNGHISIICRSIYVADIILLATPRVVPFNVRPEVIDIVFLLLKLLLSPSMQQIALQHILLRLCLSLRRYGFMTLIVSILRD